MQNHWPTAQGVCISSASGISAAGGEGEEDVWIQPTSHQTKMRNNYSHLHLAEADSLKGWFRTYICNLHEQPVPQLSPIQAHMDKWHTQLSNTSKSWVQFSTHPGIGSMRTDDDDEGRIQPSMVMERSFSASLSSCSPLNLPEMFIDSSPAKATTAQRVFPS